MPGYRTRTVIGACVVIAAACAQQPESDTQDSQARDTTSAPTAAAPAATAPPASATPPGVRLTIARHPDLGAFLGDATGRALYMLEEDPAGESTCYEMCAAIWPPLMAGQGTPTAGDSGVREELIGTVPRRGAGAQVTYNRRPLYYYMGDARPGETRGQHVEDSWGEWYLMSPTGWHVEDRGDDGRRSGRRGEDERDRNP